MESHIKTRKYKDAVKRKENQSRLEVLNSGDNIKNFHMNLIKSFIAANILLNKLGHPVLKNSLKIFLGIS